jgi:putative glutamine amidotransferase
MTYHQSVETVGPDLVINARATDGVIKGIEAPDHPFLVGVQCHPEILYRPIRSAGSCLRHCSPPAAIGSIDRRFM